MLLAQDETKNKLAVICIKVFWNLHPSLCAQKIFNVIAAPFLLKSVAGNEARECGQILCDEEQVTKSIQVLVKYLTNNQVSDEQVLPTEMLTPISVPLFGLYRVQSISALRSCVKQLILQLLTQESLREELFSVFLNVKSQTTKDLGVSMCFQLGPSGGYQIVDGDIPEEGYFSAQDALLELANADDIVSLSLFNFLLKVFGSQLHDSNKEKQNSTLECDQDVINRLGENLSNMNLLYELANSAKVQTGAFENPAPLLSMVKLFMSKKRATSQDDQDDVDVASAGLMLIKMILAEKRNSKSESSWQLFEDFLQFSDTVLGNLSSLSKSMLKDVKSLVATRGVEKKRRYQDLAFEGEKESSFQKALKDRLDPLLPVQAHGLISLTRLIDAKDPEALENKDLLLCLLQVRKKGTHICQDSPIISKRYISGKFTARGLVCVFGGGECTLCFGESVPVKCHRITHSRVSTPAKRHFPRKQS